MTPYPPGTTYSDLERAGIIPTDTEVAEENPPDDRDECPGCGSIHISGKRDSCVLVSCEDCSWWDYK